MLYYTILYAKFLMQSPLEKWASIPALTVPPRLEPHQIKKLHVYDWDNTLFKSFLPNKSLYNPITFNRIQRDELPGYGGWWNDSKLFSILIRMANLEGNIEEYWNHELLNLSLQSNEADDTVSIVMTGRKEDLFATHFQEIIQMTLSHNPEWRNHIKFNAFMLKKLIPEDFDNVDHVRNLNTADYKNKVLADFITFYPNLQEVTIYDDRISQVNSFKKFFQQNVHLSKSLQWFVIPIVPQVSFLPPPLEYDLLRYNCALVNTHYRTQNNVKTKMVKLFEKSSNYGYYISHISQLKLYKILKEALRQRFPDNEVNIVNFKNMKMFIPTHERRQNWSLTETVKCLRKSPTRTRSKQRSKLRMQNYQFLQHYQSAMLHDAIRQKTQIVHHEEDRSIFNFKFKLNKLLYRCLERIELDEYDKSVDNLANVINVEIKLNIEPMGHAYTQYDNFFITADPNSNKISDEFYQTIQLDDIEISTHFGCQREMKLKIQKY